MADDTPEIINQLQEGVPPALALLAGMQLEVFSALGDECKTAAQIAAALSLDEERLARLLYALVLTGLLVHEDRRFANAPEARRFLVKGRPGYIGAMHELLGDIWHADLHTAASIRTRGPAALHDFDAMDDDALAAFMRGLQPYAAATGRSLAEHFDFARCALVIDIGGGSGATLLALLAQHQHLRGTLLELSRVARVAATLLSSAQAERLEIQVGDIVAAPPAGLYDAAILRAVIQVLSPADAERAIRHAFACLRAGGTIYITGSGILADDRLRPPGGVYVNLTLMNFYRAGAAYTHSTHAEWLRRAGFQEPRHRTLPTGSEIIWATKAT
jgi:SAM-dependent methyltransferase